MLAHQDFSRQRTAVGSKEENPKLQRLRYALRVSGVPGDRRNLLRSGIHTRGYLPHVKREGATYFVTFRLADALPQQVLREWEAERAASLGTLQAGPGHTERPEASRLEAVERAHHRKIERWLDAGAGRCWLRRPDIAQIVVGALQFFAGQRYHLESWVVMPNHVHVVLWPMPNHLLSGILQSWKRFTAREANRRLGLGEQRFWQPESYDHWIRDELERGRCCRYVERNPVAAGLCARPEDWPWSSAGWKSTPAPRRLQAGDTAG